MTAAVVAAVAYALWFLAVRGYLPQPFYGDPSQTLMDLYNTAYWANRPGAYDVWGSVYPPLSFIVLRLVTIHHCYVSGPEAARACDGEPLAMLAIAYLACWPMLAAYYARLDRSTAAMRTIATGLGLPLLYALERGNLIVASFALALPAFGLRPRSGTAHHLLAALSFNLKPYASIILSPWVPQRRWRAIAAYVAAFMTIYFGSCVIVGGGWPLDLLHNVQRLARATGSHAWNNIYYATTFNQLRGALLQDGFAQRLGLGAAMVGPLRLAASAVIAIGEAGVLACYAAAFIRPGRVVVPRLMAVALLFVLTTWGASGYATVYLIPILLRERADRPLTALIVLSAYLLCVPADFVVRPLMRVTSDSYLGARSVVAEYGLAVGQLARPALLLIVEYALVALIALDLFGRRPAAACEGAKPRS